MSDKDVKLVRAAEAISCYDWPSIDKYIEQAESPEAKERLRAIQVRKYHREEYRCGLL